MKKSVKNWINTWKKYLIYEDLIQVLPNVCDSAGETTGITYTAIIPVLTKEIQNLRRRLAAVENELSSYKSKT